MRIGLLADSHDRLPAMAEFARRFSDAGVDLTLHAGDFCSPFSLRPFEKAILPLVGVFGRNDGDHEGLRAEAANGMGIELYESPHFVNVGEHRILVVHDIGEVSQRTIEEHTVVVHGCTHRQETRTAGKTLLVNPGEACGWLHGQPTACILDVATLSVEVIALDRREWER